MIFEVIVCEDILFNLLGLVEAIVHGVFLLSDGDTSLQRVYETTKSSIYSSTMPQECS